MPKLIGGIAALVALAAGILAHVDPVATVQRAALAFILGSLATQVWYVFFTVRIQRLGHNSQDENESVESELNDAPPAQAA